MHWPVLVGGLPSDACSQSAVCRSLGQASETCIQYKCKPMPSVQQIFDHALELSLTSPSFVHFFVETETFGDHEPL